MSYNPVIILVRPQMGENIGASARAMLNFGLTEMRIVNPRDGWPNAAAEIMAAGAFETITVKVFETLQDAGADLTYMLATTVRPRDMVKPVMGAQDAARQMRTREGQKIAYVFGPERSGLDNDEIARCDGIIAIPVNPDFGSLNLGAAVLVCAYEWFQCAAPEMIDDHVPAPHGAQEELTVRLTAELESAGFFRSAGHAPIMKRNIRNTLLRARLTDQELRSFHGMLTALIRKVK